MSARSPKRLLASAMVAMASGEVMVISSAVTPPASNASQMGISVAAESTRITATMPGLRMRWMISDLFMVRMGE